MTRYGMVINLDRCVGCHACSTACTIHHGLPKDVRWSDVCELTEGVYPDLATMFLPTLCMQCSKPMCVAACTTGATYQDEDGVVVIDADKCDGCGACVDACPYHARTVVGGVASNHAEGGPTAYESQVFPAHVAGVVEKCTFCADCREQGEDPWCVKTCVSNARTFGDLDDPESEVAKLAASENAHVLLEAEGTEPAVYYLSTSRIAIDDTFATKTA